MYLIPYVWDTRSPDWYKLAFFLLEGGRSLWLVDETASDAELEAMLLENGFPVVRFTRDSGDRIFAEIDPTRLNLAAFYRWNEVDPATAQEDVWREFEIPRQFWNCPIYQLHFWKGLEGLRPTAVFTVESS
jgi:hypothetical protein